MEQAASHTSPESSRGHGPAQRKPGPEGPSPESLHGWKGHGDLSTSGQALLTSLVRRASPLPGQLGQSLWAPKVYGKQTQEVPEPSHLLGPSTPLGPSLCPHLLWLSVQVSPSEQ